MPFAPGSMKPPNSGRKKSPDSRRTVQEILRQIKCDPIEGMAQIAMDKNQHPSLRGKMFAELAQYLHPKRRAVELSGPDGGPVPFSLSDIDQAVAEARQRREQAA